MPFSHWQEQGAWISCAAGFRQILPEEVGNALGLNKPARSLLASKAKDHFREELLKTTSIFHWEYLTTSLLPLLAPGSPKPTSNPVSQFVEAVPKSMTHATFKLLKERAHKWTKAIEFSPVRGHC
jgi:hypothetical protein